MKDKITTWLKSLHGKSRFDLMYKGTDLYLSDDCIIAADVNYDFLIFRRLDAELRAADLFSVGIEEFKEWSADYCADRIINQL